MQLPR